MKPVLLLCLGNPLMGDDGVAWHIGRQLSRLQSLPEDVEVLLHGGTDLLRLAEAMEGRERVILLDAIDDPSPPGSLLVHNGGFLEWPCSRQSAHQLSAPQALHLLKLASPGLNQVRFTLLGVAVGPVEMCEALSPAAAERLPSLVAGVLGELLRASQSA